jgi:type IV pilus assembly protein PilY1
MRTNPTDTTRQARLLLAGIGCALLFQIQTAGGTDIASEPLITSSSSSVKPNLFFILDNSGSMNWDYLPDWVVDDKYCKGTGTGTTNYCCRNASGSNITSSNTDSTCLPQNSSGTNLDGNGFSNLRGMPPFHASEFNGLYYNPAIYYQVPQEANGNLKTSYSGSSAVPWDAYGTQYSTSSTLSVTSSFPDVQWCTDTTYSDCLRNDNYLLPGVIGGKNYTTMRAVAATGTGKFSTGTPQAPTASEDRSVGPYYYVMIPSEFCTTKKLTSCQMINKVLSAEELQRVARLRWCSDTALTSCQQVKNSTFKYPRYPTVVTGITTGASATATFAASGVTASNCSGTGTGKCGSGASGTVCSGRTNVVTVSSIRVGGVTEILTSPFVYCSSSSTSGTRNSGLASAIAARIGAGFSGSPSSANVTVTSPLADDYNGKGLGYTISAASLSSATFNNAGVDRVVAVPGSFKRVDIVSGQTYGNVTDGYGNIFVDRTSRHDCAARPNCSYAEELQNFANWFAWYRSRMQMTKSAVSLAFQSVDDHFRVGYFTINSASTNLVNIGDFDSTKKSAWYTKLFNAIPSGGTPLREALANAGRIYGGKTAITGVTDPVQYSCQRNFTILSTDGYWNGNNGKKLNGSTDIGNEDGTGGGLARPELDGRNDSATLADVSAYYYNTDLRTGCVPNDDSGLCNNNVPTTTRDSKKTQHMVTYTIGLGQNGVMQYRNNYLNTPNLDDIPDDFAAIKAGTTAGSSPGECSWQTSGACNWPQPGADKQENIDDMWHAAVNGHGTYYSARDPKEVSGGLRDIMLTLKVETGAAAAATTSNPNVSANDKFVFSSSYQSGSWSGDLVMQEIDTTTGDIKPAKLWGGAGAGSKITAQGAGGRNIWTFDRSGTAGDRRKAFDWSSLNAGTAGVCDPPLSEQGCFSSPYIETLAQYCVTGAICLSADQKTAASGANLVEYLRGSRSHDEGAANAADRWYRERVWVDGGSKSADVLGDIVSSEAVYVGKYLYKYANGYPSGALRANPTVYVAANDGMLHAINATSDTSGGQERWAYVPSMALRNLHKLADLDYALLHRYFVDGTPVVSDIYEGGAWKTILVGGLAGGGPGYYALEIDSNGGGTNQTQPKVLWEFKYGNLVTGGANAGQVQDCTSGTAPRHKSANGVTTACDLGYSFGNPVIGKVGSTWVVMVTSGYNNHLGGGDGKGHLYVLNAMTGEVISQIDTTAGSTTDPSGLSKIVGWVDDAMKDNTVTAVYGGDLAGNMWAFDPAVGSARLLINVVNPITAKPEVGELITNSGSKKKVVFFPTGRLLGSDDVAHPVTGNYFYGVWDNGSSANVSDLDAVTGVSTGNSDRTGTVIPSVFENASKRGWRFPFDSQEQGNTDPTLAFGTLVFSTNKPTSADVCNESGFDSWVYNIDWLSGGVVEMANNSNTFLATHYSGAATRPTVVVIDGRVKSITRLSDASNKVADVRLKAQSGQVRRVSWRELTN